MDRHKKKFASFNKDIKTNINSKVDLNLFNNNIETILSDINFNKNYDFVLFNFIIKRNDGSLFYYNDKTYIIKNNGITLDKFGSLFKKIIKKISDMREVGSLQAEKKG